MHSTYSLNVVGLCGAVEPSPIACWSQILFGCCRQVAAAHAKVPVLLLYRVAGSSTLPTPYSEKVSQKKIS